MLSHRVRALPAVEGRAALVAPPVPRGLTLMVLASTLMGMVAGLLVWPPSPETLAQALAVAMGVVATGVILRQWVGTARSLPPRPVLGGCLAIILPACDERASIGEVLSRVPHAALRASGWAPLVVVVDDGSRDDTSMVALQEGADVVVRHQNRRGLGAALRTGLEQARQRGAHAAAYLDADGEYDPAQMLRLLAPITAGEADYVVGSRFQGRREGMRWQRTVGNYAFTCLTSVLAGRRLTDAQSGYRAFSRRALDRAEIIHDYNYAQVLTLDLLRKGMRLREVPIDYRVRRTGRSFIRGFEYCRRVVPAIARELLAD